jgi:hypothetical protein
MKVTMKMALVVCAWGVSLSATAQGTFQDLNFEEATIPPGTTYSLSVADAIPGWTLDYGSTPQTQIGYNDQSLGGTAAFLTGIGSYWPAIDGNFSIELYGGGNGQGGVEAVSISQTGQIPSGTQSLLFESGTFSFVQPVVSIGNDELTLFPVTSHGNYTTYGANISAFSGQTEQLQFTVPGGYGPYLFDDISFSPNPITATPEPDALVLMGIGGIVFALYRRISRFTPNSE